MKRFETILCVTGSTLVFTLGIGLGLRAGPGLLVAYLLILLLLPPLLALSRPIGEWLWPGAAAGRLLLGGLISQLGGLMVVYLLKPQPAGFLLFVRELLRHPGVAALLLLPLWLALLTTWLGNRVAHLRRSRRV
ncbi:hypothetical protein [Hymenobacter algoricola]|uniref:Uncharacterized protein n=1 Tax=Hymenobacter algoricola TaxID=486267 RepID=A0ABP7MRT4_9BACT